ncbi:SDR family oxidoreductase [Pseudoalteromonas piscicida]|uniref:SDR family oxidoreductase n=1 Tax=Pseudoalteromonas piscicida TaxID=43662 RepID=UPI0030C9BDB7
MRKAALICGATSTLGLLVAEKLSATNFRVLGLCRDRTFKSKYYDRLFYCDLESRDEVVKSINELSLENFDSIILLASNDIYDCVECASFENISKTLNVAVVSQVSLLFEIARKNKLTNVIVISSDVVENSCESSLSYTLSKLLLENSINYFSTVFYNVEVRCFRFPYLGYKMKNILYNECSSCRNLTGEEADYKLNMAADDIVKELYNE